MKQLMIALSTFFFLLAIMLGCRSGKLSGDPGNKNSKAVALFNGHNLNGWYKFIKDRGRNTDPKEVFTVADGMIRISGEEWGCITSNEEYSNYKLSVEYKWGGKTFAPRLTNARDNGILLHSTGKDGGSAGTWMYSIECQVIEGGTGDLLVVGDGTSSFGLSSPVASEKQNGSYLYKPGGSLATINGGRINWYGRDPAWKDVIGFRGKNDVEKPLGEWNRVECVAKGDQISIFVNGTLVNEAVQVHPSKGRIQLQSEGAEIFYRLVELTRLTLK